jgi:hypothetical protein
MTDYEIDGEFGGDPRIFEAEKLKRSPYEIPTALTAATLKLLDPDIPLALALNLLAFADSNHKIDMDKEDWPIEFAKHGRALRWILTAHREGRAFPVGTLISERPPDSSEQAQFGHSAPTLGV